MRKSKWDILQELFIVFLYIVLLYMLVTAVTKTIITKQQGGEYGVEVITEDE